jgi:hypothetical protein
MSLLPGTLSADLTDDRLRMHVLDASLPIEHELRAAEASIAALFGQTVNDLPPTCARAAAPSGSTPRCDG